MSLIDYLAKRGAARSSKPCGCEQGGYGLLFGAASSGVWLWATGNLAHPPWHTIYWCLAWVFATATIGKFIGIHLENQALARRAAEAVKRQGFLPLPPKALQRFWQAQDRKCCGKT